MISKNYVLFQGYISILHAYLMNMECILSCLNSEQKKEIRQSTLYIHETLQSFTYEADLSLTDELLEERCKTLSDILDKISNFLDRLLQDDDLVAKSTIKLYQASIFRKLIKELFFK